MLDLNLAQACLQFYKRPELFEIVTWVLHNRIQVERVNTDIFKGDIVILKFNFKILRFSRLILRFSRVILRLSW